MSAPAAIVAPQAPHPWPAPTPRHRIQPNTRLQEAQYEVTVPVIADRALQALTAAALEPRVGGPVRVPVLWVSAGPFLPGRDAGRLRDRTRKDLQAPVGARCRLGRRVRPH